MKLLNTIKALCVGFLLFAATSQTNVLNAEWDTAYWSDSYIDYLSAYDDYEANAQHDWAYEYYFLGEAFPYYHYYLAGYNMDLHTRFGQRGYLGYNSWLIGLYNYHAGTADYYWLTYY